MSAHLPLADILFISEFSAFCRTKGDEEYDEINSQTCALGQFGFPGAVRASCVELGVPVRAYDAAVRASPRTFSALADRLDALVAHAPKVVL